MLSVYDFFNPVGNKGQDLTVIGVSWQYWLAIIISIGSIACLFIFKKTYFKLANSKLFLKGLGVFQLTLYVVYYSLQMLYLYYFKAEGKLLRGWTWIFPLHLSSITQLISGILLIKASDKLFSITAPWVVILVFFSLLIPADKATGPQHFFYWLYYVVHIIIIFTYWFLYMYGLVKFDTKWLKQSFIFLLLFSVIALGFNALTLVIAKNKNEITNFLFIGYLGYPLWGNVTTANILGSQKLWPLGYFFLLIFAMVFVCLGFLILTKVQPYYVKKKDKLVAVKAKTQPWNFKALKAMFKIRN